MRYQRRPEEARCRLKRLRAVSLGESTAAEIHQTKAGLEERKADEKDRKTNKVDEGWAIVKKKRTRLKEGMSISPFHMPKTTEQPAKMMNDDTITTVNGNQQKKASREMESAQQRPGNQQE